MIQQKPRVLLLVRAQAGGFEQSSVYTEMEIFRQSVNGLADFELVVSAIDCLEFSVINGMPRIYDAHNRLDVSDYDMLHVRNVERDHDFFKAVGVYAEHYNIAIFEHQDVAPPYFGKLSQMFLFAVHDIPVPDTWACWDSERFLRGLRDGVVGWPCIIKANDGIKGNYNYLVNDIATAEEVLADSANKKFIAQKFVPNDGTCRILYLGSNREPFVFKRSNAPGTHLGNVAQGAQVSRLTFSDLSVRERELADQAYEVMSREHDGVDLIEDKETKRWYVLEANTTPALYSGSLQGEKVQHYIEFMTRYTEAFSHKERKTR